MKTLSIRQPWAWLITNGYKDIENRTWKTKHEGQFLIHAGKKKPTKEEWKEFQIWLKSDFDIILPEMSSDFGVHFGGVVGTACLIDCVDHSNSKWFDNSGYGFRLTGAKPLPFIPVKGKLSFFDVEYPFNASNEHV
jgi:hypothetical protein